MTSERNLEPVMIIENLDSDEIEQMLNKIRTGEKVMQKEEQIGKIEHEN